MKINWKLRLQNKVTLVTLITLILGFAYQLLAVIGVCPTITKDAMSELFMMVVEILVALGVVIDPTTKGIDDSDRAMNYDKLG